MLPPAETYALLRHLTTPLVAVTTRWRERRNGLVATSAQRASLSLQMPRLSVSIHKWTYTYELLWKSGRFAVHLLHPGQLELVHLLGFTSGREVDKLAGVACHTGFSGSPILNDCFAWFDCRVVNVMDAGAYTCFLGDVVAAGRGPGAEVLTSEKFRSVMPESWQREYALRLARAQEWATAHSQIEQTNWPGPEDEDQG